MIRRILLAYRIELIKAGHRGLTFLGPALMLLAVASAMVAKPLERDHASDYAFLAYATTLALNTLGLVLNIAFSASLLAPEIQQGSIRGVLVRPIRRVEYLLGKYLCAATYALLLILAAAGGAWVLLLLLGDAEGVTIGGDLVFPAAHMARSYVYGAALSLLPFAAAAAYGLFVSCCARSGAAAVTLAIGLWFMLDFLKYQANVAPLLFSSHLDLPWEHFTLLADGIESDWQRYSVPVAATSLPAIAMLLSAATLVLRARSFTR